MFSLPVLNTFTVNTEEYFLDISYKVNVGNKALKNLYLIIAVSSDFLSSDVNISADFVGKFFVCFSSRLRERFLNSFFGANLTF